jgi:hypothetical protein
MVSSEGLPYLVTSYDMQGDASKTYSNPNSHGLTEEEVIILKNT